VSVTAANAALLAAAKAQVFGATSTARGAIVATPTAAGAGIYALRIPYLFYPRGTSNITAGAKSAYDSSARASVPLSNTGVHRGDADVYMWGIHDDNDVTGAEGSMDVRDVGLQVLPKSALCGTDTSGTCGTVNDRSLVFAINTYGQASNPGVNEFDILIDTHGNGHIDYFVVGVDFGAVSAGDFSGQYASFIFDGNGNIIDVWVAGAPMNGSVIELPALASTIGLLPGVNSTKFRYAVNAFSIVPGGLTDTTGFASMRVDQPPMSSGDFISLNPGASATLTVQVDKAKFQQAPQLGWLVVALDNANGASQAREIPVGTLP
jgi:hypothetical protein